MFQTELFTQPATPSKVRCISLWQPWASLMAGGAKFVETRSWDTRIRGEIHIHAGATKTPIREMMKAAPAWIELVEAAIGVPVTRWLEDLPYGALIAKGILSDTLPIEWARATYPDQIPFGDFTPGRYGHLYTGLESISPIPLKGAQGFFFTSLAAA